MVIALPKRLKHLKIGVSVTGPNIAKLRCVLTGVLPGDGGRFAARLAKSMHRVDRNNLFVQQYSKLFDHLPVLILLNMHSAQRMWNGISAYNENEYLYVQYKLKNNCMKGS